MFTSEPNSPHFNPRLWRSSRLALMSANEPKATVVLPRQIVTDAEIESAKVVNVETVAVETVAVETPIVKVPFVQMLSNVNMGMTVAAMRKIAKKRGLKGYSKLRKADLCARLA